MRGGALKRFRVYAPDSQKGGSMHRWGHQLGHGLGDMLKRAAADAIKPAAAAALQSVANKLNPGQNNPMVKKAVQQAAQLQRKADQQATQVIQSSQNVDPGLLQAPPPVPVDAYMTDAPTGLQEGATTPYLTPAAAAPAPVAIADSIPMVMDPAPVQIAPAPVQRATPRRTAVPRRAAAPKRRAPTTSAPSALKRQRMRDVFG